MWEIKPICSVLLRNRLGAALVIMQIALTIGIIVNAISVISHRSEFMARETGLPAQEIFSFSMQPLGKSTDIRQLIDQDLEIVRDTPGVVAVTPINEIPMSGNGWGSGFSKKPDAEVGDQSANVIEIDHHGLPAQGLTLLAGRNFRPEEIIERHPVADAEPDVAIVTEMMAESLFPNGDALGATIYKGNAHPIKIVGIVEKHLGNWPHWSDAGHVVFLPQIGLGSNIRYLVRTAPEKRETIMKNTEAALFDAYPNRVLSNFRTLEERIEATYRRDHAMVKILATVIAILSLITLMGSVGLTVFWVNQRRKQIGIRRALGATKSAIVRYFLVENLLVTGIGILLGSGLGLGFNVLLVHHYEQQALQLSYLIWCGTVFLLLGLLAALLPALRAADFPPALATRSV